MKITNKIIISLLLVVVIISILSTMVFGKTVYEPTEFKNQISTDGTGTANIKTTGGKIVGTIRLVGTIVAVGMVMVLGIKYMTGSAEERAEYKKTLFPYFIGAILLFAASSLTQAIYEWASKL